MKRFTLGRQDRLKSRKLIDQLFREGKVITLAPFRVLYRTEDVNPPLLQCGFGVGTRLFKKAVDRNRIKRTVKECWRLQKQPLTARLESAQRRMNVFIIYTGKELPLYKDTFAVMNTLIQKLDATIGTGK